MMKEMGHQSRIFCRMLPIAALLCVLIGACAPAKKTGTVVNDGTVTGIAPPQKPTWPPLPSDFQGDFTMDMPTMKKLVGDSIALPIAGQFKTLSVTAVDDDGTVRIKELTLDTKINDQSFKVTINALHSHIAAEAQGRYAMTGAGSKAPQVAFVWHDFNINLPDGGVLHLLGVFQDGKLLGYSYNPTELANLKAGAVIPVFGGTGWQVVKVTGPPAREAIQLVGGGHLRLLQAPGTRVGLVP